MWRDNADPYRASPEPFTIPRPKACTLRRRLLLMGATATTVSVEGQNGAADWMLLYQGPVPLMPVCLPRVVTRLRVQTGGGTAFVQLQDDDDEQARPTCC